MEILIAIILVIVIIVCILSIFYFLSYNKYQDLIIRINEVESLIDNSLRTKYDLINRSIAIIKASIKLDKPIFEEIIKLRSRKIGNFELDRNLNEAYNEFVGIKEKYKEINNSEELKKIDTQIIDINDKLTTSINYYNQNITKYNKLLKSFPTNIVALLCKYKERLFFDRKNMSDEDYEDFKL